MLDVELRRLVDLDDPDGEVWWSAEWGLRGESVGVEDSTPDLQELVNSVVEDAQEWAARFDMRIEWSIDGDRPEGQTVEDAIAALGVTLPDRPPAV